MQPPEAPDIAGDLPGRDAAFRAQHQQSVFGVNDYASFRRGGGYARSASGASGASGTSMASSTGSGLVAFCRKGQVWERSPAPSERSGASVDEMCDLSAEVSTGNLGLSQPPAAQPYPRRQFRAATAAAAANVQQALDYSSIAQAFGRANTAPRGYASSPSQVVTSHYVKSDPAQQTMQSPARVVTPDARQTATGKTVQVQTASGQTVKQVRMAEAVTLK